MSLPVTGYDIDKLHQIDFDVMFVSEYLLLPVFVIGILSWIVIFAAVFKDNHHSDPNYLLVLSLGSSDLLMLISGCYIFISSAVDDGGYTHGFDGCVLETMLVAVAFCASGLAISTISIDRYLQLCLGVNKSWQFTLLLLVITWLISTVLPAIFVYTNLPDSVMLVSRMFCIPNFISNNPSVRAWMYLLVTAVFLCFSIVIFCYWSIYDMYVSSLKRRFQLRKSQRVVKLPPKLSANASKLLYKFAVISGTYIATFMPITLLFMVWLADPSLMISNAVFIILFSIHILSPVLNPYLLYFLDARLKITVNGMLRLDRRMRNQKPNTTDLQLPRLPKLAPNAHGQTIGQNSCTVELDANMNPIAKEAGTFLAE